MHRTDTTEYRTHAPPSAVSVVPAQSYLIYLCASSPDIASSIVDISRPILAISTFMNTDRADALREVLQKGEMLAGSTADKRSTVLPSPCATQQLHHSETIRPRRLHPSNDLAAMRHPDCMSQSSHEDGRREGISQIQPSDRPVCEPILTHRPSTSRKSLIQSRLAVTL